MFAKSRLFVTCIRSHTSPQLDVPQRRSQWQSHLGWDDLPIVNESRRHSLADIPTRRGSFAGDELPYDHLGSYLSTRKQSSYNQAPSLRNDLAASFHSDFSRQTGSGGSQEPHGLTHDDNDGKLSSLSSADISPLSSPRRCVAFINSFVLHRPLSTCPSIGDTLHLNRLHLNRLHEPRRFSAATWRSSELVALSLSTASTRNSYRPLSSSHSHYIDNTYKNYYTAEATQVCDNTTYTRRSFTSHCIRNCHCVFASH